MRRTIENTTPQEILPIIWRMIDSYTRQIGYRHAADQQGGKQ